MTDTATKQPSPEAIRAMKLRMVTHAVDHGRARATPSNVAAILEHVAAEIGRSPTGRYCASAATISKDMGGGISPYKTGRALNLLVDLGLLECGMGQSGGRGAWAKEYGLPKEDPQ